MDFLGWKWYDCRDGVYGEEIPSLEEIKKTALECLEGEYSTGGFWTIIDESKKKLQLHFSIDRK